MASDDAETLDLIVPTLRNSGAAVFPAITAQAAWALCNQIQGVNLMIAHTTQPESLDLVLRAHESNPSLAFLFVVGPTSYGRGNPGAVPGGLLIREPFTPGVFLRAVVDLLERYRAA